VLLETIDLHESYRSLILVEEQNPEN